MARRYDSLINWRRGDYIKLGKAVKEFNRIIDQFDSPENSYLPSYKSYENLKEHITSRNELNRIIKSLKRANEENLLKKVELPSGATVSSWEYSELKKGQKRALRNIQSERETILSERQSIGMGEERLSELREAEETVTDVFNRTGGSLEYAKKRIELSGRLDYGISKDKLFMDNFYKALEGAKGFKNYELLEKKLSKIKNPTKFYEYVKQSPFLMDIFYWYKNVDVNLYGGFDSNEEAFDSSLLFHLDISEVEV